jgi:hypothetical protein
MKPLSKLALILVIVAQITTSCNSAQSDAQKQADLIEKTMKENSPGSVTTTESGTYMTAKIDGREWTATALIPDNNASSNTKLVRGQRGKDMIQFQLYKPRNIVGTKVSFGDGNSAGIYIESDPALLSGRRGELEITKVDEQWVEGIFHFTATGTNYDATGNSSKKTVEVTDGRFRVQNR